MAVKRIKKWILSRRNTSDLNRNIDVGALRQEDIESLISEQAYSLFEERGGYHGCDVDDWVEAERIVAKFLEK